MIAFLASFLPGFLLPAVQNYFQHKRDIATSQERTKRETQLAAINGVIEGRKAQAQVITAGMQHKAFWLVWLCFALPLGIWWCAVIMDSLFLFSGDIPALPPSVRPWADQIFQNIFYSGGGVAGASVLARAIAGRR